MGLTSKSTTALKLLACIIAAAVPVAYGAMGSMVGGSITWRLHPQVLYPRLCHLVIWSISSHVGNNRQTPSHHRHIA